MTNVPIMFLHTGNLAPTAHAFTAARGSWKAHTKTLYIYIIRRGVIACRTHHNAHARQAINARKDRGTPPAGVSSLKWPREKSHSGANIGEGGINSQIPPHLPWSLETICTCHPQLPPTNAGYVAPQNKGPGKGRKHSTHCINHVMKL